ncbi:hypothetical protein [Leifsonia poae]|uniref:hypothetical protein n=1 Tax=Leifsonia poae TaxID=110933 RepID=UPI001CC05109|nr:hypothetical protein [Leifsonia poae]
MGKYAGDPSAIFALELTSEKRFWLAEPDEPRFSRWSAALSLIDDGSDAGVLVAHGLFLLYRNARWDGRFLDRMDEDSSDMERIASAIVDESGSASDDIFGEGDVFGGDVVIADRIEVLPEFRQHGYSHMLVDSVARELAPDGAIALLPMPPGDQSPGPVSALQRHWAAGGYVERRHGVFTRPTIPALVEDD